MTLSVVMVTYNSADVVEEALRSIEGLWDELLVGDAGSRDGTVEIVKKYGGMIVTQKAKDALGKRKQELVERAKGPARNATPASNAEHSSVGWHSVAGGDWILVLDADERVSPKLADEIRHIMKGSSTAPGMAVAAYRIPYQNYVFGGPVYYGGEKYAKVRLFRRGYAKISPDPLHEEVVVAKGTMGELTGKIHHHSYRTPLQLIKKFTSYSATASRSLREKGEQVTVKKLFFYGPHMVWARYIKENGYKDGWRGLVLALAFGYMEGLTYWLALVRRIL